MTERPGGRETGSLYESMLGAGAAPARPPAPRTSASVVPWRAGPTPGTVEVYWVHRAETLPFMGGWEAFPGGALAKTDASLPVTGSPVGLARDTFTPPDPMSRLEQVGADDVPGLVAAALRELYEETGLLVSDRAVDPVAQHAARLALLEGGDAGPLLESLEAGRLNAGRLAYAGRWLTPPFAPRRFDSRFFLLAWPREETVQPTVIPGELASGAWIECGAAWQAWHRGEVMTAPPILHILKVLAEDGPDHGLGRLLDTHEANLGPLRRVELRPGVLMFPLATRTLPPATTTNAYLLGHGEAVLVDPGSPDDAENERLLAAIAASGRQVTAIWLTHHHPDHIGGVQAVRQALRVPVRAHALTAERLAAQGISVDGWLADGDRVVLPGAPPMTVRAVHTPGHARGHLCFFDEGGRSLLAGDMVAGVGTIVVDPPEGDMDDYLASLGKLAALGATTLFPGHGPAVPHATEKLVAYRDHRLWRESKILAAWKAGRQTPADMVAEVYEDVPAQAHPLAERQIEAHLARLRRAGELS